jgi:hypothetical protein
MSMNGVKFFTRIAACLAIFDTKSREPGADTEIEPAPDPDSRTPPAERLSLRFYPHSRITCSMGALAVA